MSDTNPSLFDVAADLARLEAATVRPTVTAETSRAADVAITRADRVRFVAQLRHAFRFPDECDERAPLTSEGARVRDCLDAGVDPYGEL